MIALVVTFAFCWILDLSYAFAATVSLIHAVLVTVEFLSLFNKEFGSMIVAALLTIIGYSINEVGGVWLALANLGLFVWAINTDHSAAEAMTMTLVAVVLFEFVKAYNFRSDWHSVFRRPWANKWLNLAIVWELLLLALIVYLPVLQAPFSTYSLPLSDWAIVLALALTVIPVLEIAKWMLRRQNRFGNGA